MIKRLFGKSFAKWYTRLMRHQKYRWVVLLGTLLYLISPLDIAPDFLPVIGWIDDGLIATLAITEISQLILERKRRPQASSRFAQDAQDRRSTQGPETATIIDIEAMPVN